MDVQTRQSQNVGPSISNTGAYEERSKVLQHFEYAVLKEVRNLDEMAFPAEIARRLSKQLDRHVSLAQVFLTLERLEDKDFVSSTDSNPRPVRGGRRRRIFEVKTSGAQALELTAAAYQTSPPEQVRRNNESGPTGEPQPA